MIKEFSHCKADVNGDCTHTAKDDGMKNQWWRKKESDDLYWLMSQRYRDEQDVQPVREVKDSNGNGLTGAYMCNGKKEMMVMNAETVVLTFSMS